jgi:hypothetical protein
MGKKFVLRFFPLTHAFSQAQGRGGFPRPCACLPTPLFPRASGEDASRATVLMRARQRAVLVLRGLGRQPQLIPNSAGRPAPPGPKYVSETRTQGGANWRGHAPATFNHARPSGRCGRDGAAAPLARDSASVDQRTRREGQGGSDSRLRFGERRFLPRPLFAPRIRRAARQKAAVRAGPFPARTNSGPLWKRATDLDFPRRERQAARNLPPHGVPAPCGAFTGRGCGEPQKTARSAFFLPRDFVFARQKKCSDERTF